MPISPCTVLCIVVLFTFFFKFPYRLPFKLLNQMQVLVVQQTMWCAQSTSMAGSVRGTLAVLLLLKAMEGGCSTEWPLFVTLLVTLPVHRLVEMMALWMSLIGPRPS